ncbi:trypsin-like peptidase domain-containing protein [candidate division KSB1 bacterium]|nr:trypsin-like peptidase domain-containing protein [candidate division KSB1 bacterium]
MSKWIVYGFIAGFLMMHSDQNSFASSPSVLEQLQQEIQGILKNTRLAVVTISLKSYRAAKQSENDGFLSMFREKQNDDTYVLHHICTGIIYNKDGYVITKSRYVHDADELLVTLNDGSQIKPKLIGVDPASGIAVLRIQANLLHPVQIGTLDHVEVGSWITVVGNSLGLASSAAFGIVEELYDKQLMEISANVQPGNNGSPVFDIHGKLVGIIIAQAESRKSMIPGFWGRGLAIPIEQVDVIVQQIIDSTDVQRAWLGVQVAEDTSGTPCLIVTKVFSQSPAAKAGVRIGDQVLMFNNARIRTLNELDQQINVTKPGTMVPIIFTRDGAKLNTIITVGKRDANSVTLDMVSGVNAGTSLNAFSQDQKLSIQQEIIRLEQEIQYLKSITQ